MREITTNHGDYRVTDTGKLEFRPNRPRRWAPFSVNAKAGLVIARDNMVAQAEYHTRKAKQAQDDAVTIAILLAMVSDA